MRDAIERSAQRLIDAASTGVPCEPIIDLLPDGTVDDAYAVQQRVIELTRQGARRVGRKIGLTSPVVQQMFGVDRPDFGVLFGDMAIGDSEPVPATRLMQPRVEAEVAFVLGSELPEHQVTVADVVRATDFLLPAIEVVDSRIAGWDISIVDTVADNASSGRYVLGTTPRRVSDVDLRLCGAVLESAGEPVSVGAGAACLGNPLHAVAWLATTLAGNGSPLRAGDVVLSGALGPMVPVTPGASYEARISGLGSVRANFAKGANQ